MSGRLVVDLDALVRNYELLRRTVVPSTCGAVVKANAYGLGVEPVVRRLYAAGCRDFFVATLGEGVELRGILPHAHIYVFEGAMPRSVTELAAAKLIPVLNTLSQVECWAKVGGSAVLHLDTGMTRLGLGARDVEALASRPGLLERLDLEYVMTHLACADEPDHDLNETQIAAFEMLRRRLPAAKTSIGNSAGALRNAAYRGDLARPGIALYGGNPFVGRANPVEAVVRLQAEVLQLRAVDAAATVGYGATYAAEPPARIAVVGVGYADGYPRRLGNVGIASVAGTRVPVVGRVSMDLLCLDVSALPEGAVREGDWVDLIGAAIPLDEVAAAAGTISYEILTGLGARLQREYLGNSSKE